MRPLYRHVGTWRTAGDKGAARHSGPEEVNGLQAHLILHHGMAPAIAFSMSVHHLARAHGSDRVTHLPKKGGTA